MPRTAPALLSLAALAAGAAPAAASEAPAVEMPSAVPHLDLLSAGERPAWISLEAAMDQAGEVRWELFDPTFPDRLRRRTEQLAADPEADPEELCTSILYSHGSGSHLDGLDAVVEHALAAFRGRVLARDHGFAGGLPATLLAIEVEERILGHRSLAGDPILFVVYPRGTFTFAGVPLCGGLAGFEPPPSVGDRLLVLAHEEPLDRRGRVVQPAAESVFVETVGGVTATEGLTDHDEIRDLPGVAALGALIRGKIAGDPAARAFDREACTPAVLRDRGRYQGLGPHDGTWPDRHWSQNCTQLLVIDLERDRLPGIAGPEHAVRFDLEGDGSLETTSWPYPTQALPWLDLDGDGAVGGGHELFSVHTRMPDGTVGPTAFEALAAYDDPVLGGDGDGAVGPADLVWQHLRLWIDHDHDGRSGGDEVFRPADLCLARLSLDRDEERRHDGQGHVIWSTSEALRRDERGKPLRGLVIEISTKREVE